MIIHRASAIGIVLAFVAAAAAPAFAAGNWLAGDGRHEPSTALDTPDVMFPTANVDAVEKVYLNGFTISGTGDHLNAEGSTVRHSYVRFAAFLGFWRDCNGDGFVGAKTVPQAYGSTLGHHSNGAYPAEGQDVDLTICGPGTPYHAGEFIDEFRWIGPNATPNAQEYEEEARNGPCPNPERHVFSVLGSCAKTFWKDPNDVTDSKALVWGDWNRPDQPAAPTRPLISNDMTDDSSSTLEFANFALKIDRRLEQEAGLLEEGTWANKPNFGACDEGSGFGEGPAFLGVTGTCGAYPLWQAERLVNDSDDAEEGATPVVRVYDTERDDAGGASPCDDTALPGGFFMADVEPGLSEDPLMDGSVYGTVNNVQKGLGGGGVARLNGECSRDDAPSLTSNEEAPSGKVTINTALSFGADERFRHARTVGPDFVPLPTFGAAYGAKWLGTTTYITVTRVPALEQPEFETVYADVSPEAFANNLQASPTTALPAGNQDAHTYGDPQCPGGFEDTPENQVANEFGWVCSAAAWERHYYSVSPSGTFRYFPGMSFDLRDVDCSDHSPHGDVDTPDATVPTPDGELNLRPSCASWHNP